MAVRRRSTKIQEALKNGLPTPPNSDDEGGDEDYSDAVVKGEHGVSLQPMSKPKGISEDRGNNQVEPRRKTMASTRRPTFMKPESDAVHTMSPLHDIDSSASSRGGSLQSLFTGVEGKESDASESSNQDNTAQTLTSTRRPTFMKPTPGDKPTGGDSDDILAWSPLHETEASSKSQGGYLNSLITGIEEEESTTAIEDVEENDVLKSGGGAAY